MDLLINDQIVTQSVWLDCDGSQDDAPVRGHDTVALKAKIRYLPRDKDAALHASQSITSLIKAMSLDEFFECISCCGRFNKDQGVFCVSGAHFICCDDECIDNLINDQIPKLQYQENNLLCSVCKIPYDLKEIATKASAEHFRKLQSAHVDARVAVLQQEMDRKVKEYAKRLYEDYNNGNTAELTKQQALEYAAQAREQALNLQCPHCKTPYAEFDGCMALTCASCKGFFCGYCHQTCKDGMGAHQHVRLCRDNLCPKRTYYATADQVRTAQAQYRRNQLNKFLNQVQERVTKFHRVRVRGRFS
jgi:hypothetical protein